MNSYMSHIRDIISAIIKIKTISMKHMMQAAVKQVFARIGKEERNGNYG